MKLHLPHGLRRALFHTFMAVLTGAAALAAPSWADVNLPDGFISPTATGMSAHHGNYTVLGEVTWDKDGTYTAIGNTLNVGDYLGNATLTVAADTKVGVGNALFIGGVGYYDNNPPGYSTGTAHEGVVNIEKGASLEVSSVNSNTAGVHLDIANGSNSKGAINVKGGTLISNYMTYVGKGGTGGGPATGTLNVTDAGQVILNLPTRITTTDANYLEVGVNANSTGLITLDGKSTLVMKNEHTSSNAGVYSFIGNGSSGAIEIRGESTVDLAADGASGYVVLGYMDNGASKASGKILVEGGSHLHTSDAYVGYAGTGENSLTVTGSSEATIDGALIVGFNSTGKVDVRDGGSASVAGFLCVGQNEGSSGSVTVEGEGSSLDVSNGYVYVGYVGRGELNIENKAQASASIVEVNAKGNAKVSEGASLTAYGNWQNPDAGAINVYSGGSMSVDKGASVLAFGDMSVAENGSVTVENSDVTVLGAYDNAGTTMVALGDGNKFAASSVENTGTMSVTVAAGAAFDAGAVTVEEGSTMNIDVATGADFKVGTYTNRGNSTITAESDTICYFGGLVLEEGSMTMEGEGKYTLGAPTDSETASSTVFTVSGERESTFIDITPLSSKNFDLDVDACFTLDFAGEALARAAAGQPQEFRLLLIKGYQGFTLSDEELAILLSNTTYQYTLIQEDTPEPFSLLSLEGVNFSDGSPFRVLGGATYVLEDNNLYWTGAVVSSTIPEPSAATLSLLALASLAARRRRR